MLWQLPGKPSGCYVFVASEDMSSCGVGDLSWKMDSRWDFIVRSESLEPYFLVQVTLMSCVMLGEIVNLPKLQFPHL